MEGSSKREQLLQRPRGERAYGEGRHENSSVWLEHGLGGETWEEMKLKRNRRQTAGDIRAHGGSYLKTLDSILWALVSHQRALSRRVT